MSKKLYRDIEQLVRKIDASAGDEGILRAVVRRLVAPSRNAYGIESGRLYREQSEDYLLIESIGEFGQAIAGKSVAKDYPIILEMEKKRLVLISPDTPGFDPDLEAQFTQSDYAAIMVGANPSYILSFGIRHTGSEEELLVMLETIRAAVGLKLRQRVLEDQLRQARGIQMSLLPNRLPQMKGFDLAAATFPAEEVGGDIYDVQRVGTGILGIAVADASGHGLPAALQAQDVVTGLRMGVAKDQKITATIHRLNRVIHQSGLSSRFISLFYGEVEETGNIFFVNCGHPSPLLLDSQGAAFELKSSGPVLGPLPKAEFRRSYATLRPGEYLVVFTDGVTERKAASQARSHEDFAAADQEFGQENLVRVCRQNLGRSAKRMVSAVIEAVRRFGGQAPFADDVTVLVLHRLPAEHFAPKMAPGAVAAQPPPASGQSR